MGHNTLGIIPGNKSWRDVVALLSEHAPNPAVIAASAKAAEADLLRAANDPVYVEAVRLLLNIPLAARADDFGQALRDVDLSVSNKPELIELLIAATERLDLVRSTSGARSDMGELAARALASTLTSEIGDALPGLFGSTPEDVQAIAKRLSWSKGISEWTRSFFGHLLSGTLSYWLDRTLDDHIGPGQRFTDITHRDRFDQELDHYASEATRIIKEFSGGWYGKTIHDTGGIGSAQAAAFGHVALRKIVAELRVRHARNA